MSVPDDCPVQQRAVRPTFFIAGTPVLTEVADEAIVDVEYGHARVEVFGNQQAIFVDGETTRTGHILATKASFEIARQVVDLYPPVAAVGHIELGIPLPLVNEDAVRSVESPGSPGL